MTALSVAVERRDWRLVALYLLVGVTELAAQLPEESLAELLEALGGGDGREQDGGANRRP